MMMVGVSLATGSSCTLGWARWPKWPTCSGVTVLKSAGCRLARGDAAEHHRLIPDPGAQPARAGGAGLEPSTDRQAADGRSRAPLQGASARTGISLRSCRSQLVILAALSACRRG